MSQQSIASVRKRRNGEANKLAAKDRGVHDWYRFVLSFPPHIVRDYLEKFNINARETVLDPFCGTGTTLVECKKLGISAIGVEANALAHFASSVKSNWDIDPDGLVAEAADAADHALAVLKRDGVEDDPAIFPSSARIQDLTLRGLDADQEKLILTDSISPLPLHKALVLRDSIGNYRGSDNYDLMRLAFASIVTFSASNLQFGPEVGVGRPKIDSAVVTTWMDKIRQIANDLNEFGGLANVGTRVHRHDAREIEDVLVPNSIDFVFTSPPYPNEKDYTRTTRLESVMLGLINNRQDLRQIKRELLRSNTRGVYKGDDDDSWVSEFPEVQRLAEQIESRRIELGKTSGFERLYHRVTKLYFGGMAKHLAGLRTALKPGAHLGYVVGDQASYLRVMIRTGEILASIAESLGYEVAGIDLFRTRLATATREQLREEVLLLRWPG